MSNYSNETYFKSKIKKKAYLFLFKPTCLTVTVSVARQRVFFDPSLEPAVLLLGIVLCWHLKCSWKTFLRPVESPFL